MARYYYLWSQSNKRIYRSTVTRACFARAPTGNKQRFLLVLRAKGRLGVASHGHVVHGRPINSLCRRQEVCSRAHLLRAKGRPKVVHGFYWCWCCYVPSNKRRVHGHGRPKVVVHRLIALHRVGMHRTGRVQYVCTPYSFSFGSPTCKLRLVKQQVNFTVQTL